MALPVISAAWVIVPLLIAVILYDLRLMRIPDRLTLLFALVALVTLPLSVPFDEVLWRVAVALSVFVAGLVLFALRLMGGGDVKLLSVLMLLVPTSLLAEFGLMLSAGIFVGVAGLALARRVNGGRATRWLSISNHKGFPLGLSIGLAGICFTLMGPALA